MKLAIFDAGFRHGNSFNVRALPACRRIDLSGCVCCSLLCVCVFFFSSFFFVCLYVAGAIVGVVVSALSVDRTKTRRIFFSFSAMLFSLLMLLIFFSLSRTFSFVYSLVRVLLPLLLRLVCFFSLVRSFCLSSKHSCFFFCCFHSMSILFLHVLYIAA